MIQARRATFAVAGVLALAAASVPLTMAQPQRGRGPSGGGSRLEFLTGLLTLTDAQVAQAKTIFDAETAASETARGQMQSAQTALNEAVKASKSDAEIDRLAAAVGVISGNLAAIRAKTSIEFVALLTPAQKEKFFTIEDRQGGMRPFGPDRRIRKP